MKRLLSLIALTALAQAAAAEDQEPQGFTLICTQDESCAVEKSALVAFGQDGDYIYKTLSGNFLCSAKTFSSPRTTPDQKGQCYILDGASSSAAASSADDASTASPFLADGEYALVSRSSGKALSVLDDDEDQNGVPVVEADFTEEPYQKWQVELLDNGYYAIKATDSDKALESVNLDSKDGSSLRQYTWTNNLSQHWLIQPATDGFVKIISRVNDHAIDTYDIGKQPDDGVVLWTYWGGENQQWKLVPF